MVPLPRDIPTKNFLKKILPKKIGRETFCPNFFEEKLLPKNLLYQNFVWKHNFHPKKFLLDKTSTKEYLQKHLYQKVSENKNLAKQIKRHLHQVFSQEKCLAKNLWEEMFTKKCLDIIYQTLSGDTPYQRVLEDKFPTKNSEEKSPKQFRKKPLPKRFCLVYLRTETWNAWQFSKISFQATWNAYTWNAKRLFLRALGLGTWNALVSRKECGTSPHTFTCTYVCKVI